jgi:ribonuclease BN (tRNA processing enzyme)
LGYTADCEFDNAVAAAASDADLMLCEATLPEAYAGVAPHLTARQAGELARLAHARRLVLTHLWPTGNRDEAARDASEAFPGPISVAAEFDTFEIDSGEESS